MAAELGRLIPFPTRYFPEPFGGMPRFINAIANFFGRAKLLLSLRIARSASSAGASKVRSTAFRPNAEE